MSSTNSDFWGEAAGICTIVGLIVGTSLAALTLYFTRRQLKLLKGHKPIDSDPKPLNNDVERKQPDWKSNNPLMALMIGAVISISGTVVLAANIPRIQAAHSSMSQTTSLPPNTTGPNTPPSSIYSFTPTVPSTLSVSAASAPSNSPLNYRNIGCYKDDSHSRVLNESYTSAVSMTTHGCAEYCGSYTYFGTEYALQCFCGNNPGHGFHVEDRFCNSTCAGNASEHCGGSYYLSMWMMAG